ncbi:MAG: hypothetical protein PW786_09345 [Arachidicoccus sp.]|nr:hypothetical protein [Arachidicoccus sp.]
MMKTWLAIKVTDLRTHRTTYIDKRAFPGKTLHISNYLGIFADQCGKIIAFNSFFKYAKDSARIVDYRSIPEFNVSLSNMLINGKPLPIVKVNTTYNWTKNPLRAKIKMPLPKLVNVVFDSTKQTIDIQCAKVLHWNYQ